ncbi:MAG: Ig-like domain-containing protein [Actinomycetota bacterium]|nr:Ig-like domain-containing protein [Actinomycetota bacterium]
MPSIVAISGCRVALALAVVAAAVVLPAGAAEAVRVPETRSHRAPVGSAPVEPGFPIDYVAVYWEEPGHGDHAHDYHGDAAVRFRTDGKWGAWVRLAKDGADAPGVWNSNLVTGGDADAYQVRGVPADAGRPQSVALNTTDGQLVTVGRRPAGAAAAFANCVSRADWGADESLRSSSRSYAAVQAMTVHHTVTKNNDPDPEATVRAIYTYHTQDLGWDDIGYQYLIDEQGRLYEGRWSGADSVSCETAGGDGTDFAHNSLDELVTGAHTGGYNTGNIGVALLGDFRGLEPKAAAVSALEDGLAELATRHGLDPLSTVLYDNGTNSKLVDTISGHRDWNATECPGDRLYEDLPAIRSNVAAKMGSTTPTDAPPTVSVTSPTDGATVSATTTVTADAGDDQGVAKVEFFVDGSSIHVDTDGSDGWSAGWDTTTVVDGSHEVSATATDTAGQTAMAAVTVTVNNDSSSVSFTLEATGYKVQGLQKADLTWSGTTADNVDVYRDGRLLTTTANDGAYTDSIDRRGAGSYTYKMCEAATTTCSNEATVTF